MAFTGKILSRRFRHLNIVGCLLKRRPIKGGSRAPQDPPLATPLLDKSFKTYKTKIYSLPKTVLKRSVQFIYIGAVRTEDNLMKTLTEGLKTTQSNRLKSRLSIY